MLKKRWLILFCVLLILSVAMGGIPASALDNTTYTYTVSVDGNYVKTQDAYIPAATYMREAGLSQPGDLFYQNGLLYVADTGNKRVVIYSLQDGSFKTFGEDILTSPKGIYVTADGKIYVADSEGAAVFIFSPGFELLRKIGRPDSYLFSESSMYKPRSVAVSSDGNIYVCGEGAYEGLMQFDENGEFFGYFAANKYKMSLSERFEDLIFNAKQRDEQFVRTPRPIESIDISDRDLIYSVTRSDDRTGTGFQVTTYGNSLKMHNMTGLNIFASSKSMKEEWNFVDVAAGPYKNAFALTYSGMINEYDNSGNLIFSFGGTATESDRNGLFTNASAIDLDDETGFLYVLDQERALVQVFYPTDFANLTHQAIAALDSGDYVGSESIWGELIRLNGRSQIAHIGYGKSLFYQQQYKKALEHFKIANEREYYSDTFWQLRDQKLNEIMPYLVSAVILYAVFLIVRMIWRRKHPHEKRHKAGAEPGSGKGIGRDLLYLRQMIAHPLDSLYYLRRGERGSVLSATVIYLLGFAVYLLDMMGRSYIFQMASIDRTRIVSLTFLFFIPLVLWLAGNYLVGTINEGEASFRNIYTATAYSFAPYIIITPFIVLISYGLTQNEAFVIQLIWFVVLAWTACLLFSGVMQMQRYAFGETVKNILLVFFFMIIVVATVAIIYLLAGQVVKFVREIIQEGIYRAKL